jgi:hypothetical protein
MEETYSYPGTFQQVNSPLKTKENRTYLPLCSPGKGI